MSNLNDYNRISDRYQLTSQKPDKQFSSLPTVLGMAGDVSGKVVLDLGCGDGFFTNAIAKQGAYKVFGVDNSEEQINLAKKSQLKNTEYILGDIFENELPNADVVIAPYVLNYATSVDELTTLIRNIFNSLNIGGKLVAVVDLPEGRDLMRFGAIKSFKGDHNDGSEIMIDLYNQNNHICTLSAHYYTPDTFERVLSEVGFSNTTWHLPSVSKEGIEKLGKEFWSGYLNSPELGYLTTLKVSR